MHKPPSCFCFFICTSADLRIWKKNLGENALKKLPFFYPQQNFDYVKNSKTQQTANEDAKKKLKN